VRISVPAMVATVAIAAAGALIYIYGSGLYGWDLRIALMSARAAQIKCSNVHRGSDALNAVLFATCQAPGYPESLQSYSFDMPLTPRMNPEDYMRANYLDVMTATDYARKIGAEP